MVPCQLSGGRGRWVQTGYEFSEDDHHFRGVVLGCGTHEFDDLAVALGSLSVETASLVDHAQAVMTIMDLGVANQKFAGGGFCLIEETGADERDDCIGSLVQLVGFVKRFLERLHVGTVLGVLCLNLGVFGLQGKVLCGLVPGHAAVLVFLAAGTWAGLVSTGLLHDVLYQQFSANTRLNAPVPTRWLRAACG